MPTDYNERPAVSGSYGPVLFEPSTVQVSGFYSLGASYTLWVGIGDDAYFRYQGKEWTL